MEAYVLQLAEGLPAAHSAAFFLAYALYQAASLLLFNTTVGKALLGLVVVPMDPRDGRLPRVRLAPHTHTHRHTDPPLPCRQGKLLLRSAFKALLLWVSVAPILLHMMYRDPRAPYDRLLHLNVVRRRDRRRR